MGKQILQDLFLRSHWLDSLLQVRRFQMKWHITPAKGENKIMPQPKSLQYGLISVTNGFILYVGNFNIVDKSVQPSQMLHMQFVVIKEFGTIGIEIAIGNTLMIMPCHPAV